MLTYAQVCDSRQTVRRLPLVKKGVTHLFAMPTTLLAGDVKIEVLNLLALLVPKYNYGHARERVSPAAAPHRAAAH